MTRRVPSDSPGALGDPVIAAPIQGEATREPERLLRALRMTRARRLAIADPAAATRSR